MKSLHSFEPVFRSRFAPAALVAAILIAGCGKSPDLEGQARKSFDGLRKAIGGEAADSARSRSMLAQVDVLEERSLALVQYSRASNDRLIRRFGDRSVPDDSLLAAFHSDEQSRAELRRSVFAARADLKALATPQEWQALSEAETKALSQVAGLARTR